MKEQDIAKAIGLAAAGAAAVAALGWIFTNAQITPTVSTGTGGTGGTTTGGPPPPPPPPAGSTLFTVKITDASGRSITTSQTLAQLQNVGIANPVVGQTYTLTGTTGQKVTFYIVSSP